jgi:hypothetical protein
MAARHGGWLGTELCHAAEHVGVIWAGAAEQFQ